MRLARFYSSLAAICLSADSSGRTPLFRPRLVALRDEAIASLKNLFDLRRGGVRIEANERASVYLLPKTKPGISSTFLKISIWKRANHARRVGVESVLVIVSFWLLTFESKTWKRNQSLRKASLRFPRKVVDTFSLKLDALNVQVEPTIETISRP